MSTKPTKALLGGVELSVVTSEDVSRSNDITSRPTEKEDVTDHVQNQPFTVNITGYGVGENAWESLQKLLKIYKEGTLVKYVHRNAMDNVVIEKLDTSHHNKVDGGFQFSISLKHIKIAKSRPMSNNSADSPELKGQTSKIADMGNQPIRSK